MGGHKVVFDKTAGVCYTKGKKRMRGGEIIRGAEVKKWNALYGNNTYDSYDFVNNLFGRHNGTGTNFYPQEIKWPVAGTQQGSRIGARIDFRALRLKGWITLAPDQVKQIRWRLCLCRIDMPPSTFDFDSHAYLTQFSNADTTVPTTFDQTRLNSFCRHNFYKKFKNVDNDSFKWKVLASGCLPPTNQYRKLFLHLSGTVNGSTAMLQTSSDSFTSDIHTENAGYIPIDVTVAINDTVDCIGGCRRYFVVLEADCGFGWTNQGAADQSEIGVLLNFYARGYYTDA